MAEHKTTKLFQNGGSQAVRIPAEFRFEGDEVYIHRDEASGDVILSAEPKHNTWKEFMEFRDAHPIPDEEWEAFDAAIREARENAPPSDEDRVLKILLEEE